MTNKEYRLYPYRWVMLAVFMFVNLMMQLLWISYSPINIEAARFYHVDDLKIGFLAMSFMIAYIPLSIPESWVIDKWGFRKAVGLGAILMGVFGLLRGLSGANYSLILISTIGHSTIGIAIGQPIMINSWTIMPAKWFPREFRATTVGLVTLAGLIGVALGMVLTPMLSLNMSIANVQILYGGISAFSAILFLVFARETPSTPPCKDGEETRALMMMG